MASADIPPPPPITPWWFYTSPLPLDDPLSPLPITTSATSSTRHPPRPFSLYDTRALEKTYQGLLVSDDQLASQSTQEPPNAISNPQPVANTNAQPGTKTIPSRHHKQVHVRHHHTVTQQKEYAEEGRGHDVLNAPIQRPGLISNAVESVVGPPSPTLERGLSGLIIRGRTLGRSSTNLIRPEDLLAKQLKHDEHSPPSTTTDNRRGDDPARRKLIRGRGIRLLHQGQVITVRLTLLQSVRL